MPILSSAQVLAPQPAIYAGISGRDSTGSSSLDDLLPSYKNELLRSNFWTDQVRFEEVRQRLRATLTLVDGWDTYGSEAPNDLARARSAEILSLLELVSLSPISLRPSAEGGIAMSFVESGQRAEIEIYNTGDILTAEYSETGAPVVHEIDAATHTLMAAIRHIRVHLGA